MPTTNAARIEALSISPGKLSPEFDAEQKTYSVYVANNVESVSLTPVAGQSDAVIIINGVVAPSGRAFRLTGLQIGRNIITMEATTPDRKTKNNYSIKVTRSYPAPVWVKVRDTSPWLPRDSAGELVFRDRMWLFGGYTPDLASDVWSSADGVNWKKVGTIPCAGINIPLTWVFADKMWVVSNDGKKLFSSSDGVNWPVVLDNPPWGRRYAAGAAVFAGKMWVLGGGGLSNDIWSSPDGVHWTREAENAPWSKRKLFSMLAVHAGKLWIMGGGICAYFPFRAYNDVWSSADGKNWTEVTDNAPWPQRIWSSAVTYRNRLWLLGGFRSEPTWNNFNDVWYSSDGEQWNQLVSEEVWSPRHEMSTYVFDNKLWVVGGNAWPLTNDVWYLEIKGLAFLTQPVIEEFVQAQYTYRARADFNQSGHKVRYRLVESPGWLTINTDTGLIRGTPDVPADAPVTVEAYDDAGETARQTYTLHVIVL